MKKDVRKFGTSSKRGRQPTSIDPFTPQAGLKEPSICISCRIVYQDQHWALNPRAYQALATDPKVNRISCPACLKIAAGYPEGIITLSGSYLWEHEEEIERILENEEDKALARNPFERVISTRREENKLIIETTEKKLAEHLGRVLHKSHQGELDISWSGNPELCRVSWQRMN